MAHTPAVPTALARHRTLLTAFVALAGISLIVDQLGKGWAFGAGRDPSHLLEVWPGLFAGAQGRNFGALFSLDGSQTPLASRVGMTIVGFIAIGMMTRWAIRDRDQWRLTDAVAGGLVLGGALGNLIDRMIFGFVRDYLIAAVFPRGIFNTADIFMVAGCLLLLGAWAARSVMALIPSRPSLGLQALRVMSPSS